MQEREVLVILLKREPSLVGIGIPKHRRLNKVVAVLLQDLRDLPPGHQVFLHRALKALQLHRDLLPELLRPALTVRIVLPDLAPDRLRAPEQMTCRAQQQTVDRLTVHAGAEEQSRPVCRQIAHKGPERLLAATRIVNRELARDGVER